MTLIRAIRRVRGVAHIRALAIALLLASTSQLFAQTASLRGTVLDSTGQPLPGVTVEATPETGAAVTVAVSGANGSYAMDVAPGGYDLAFTLINFASTVRRGVTASSSPQAVDVTLYLSSTATVVVTAKRTFRGLEELDGPSDLLGFADAATVGVIPGDELDRRPFQRPGAVLEAIPGVIVSQHSGEGKANQYYLRGFNLDHGTDLAITVAGVPVNMPTHAHGQGYADANFVIPELVSAIQYRKGPYYAEEGDFASAGSASINYVSLLDKPLALVQGGMFGYGRVVVAASPEVAGGYLLYALEGVRNDGPWERGDDLRKWNGVLRYTRGHQRGGFSVTASAYDARWDSTDQIPQRAVLAGAVGRFGNLDASNGGTTARHWLATEWQRSSSSALTQVNAYAAQYRLNLFSNFTYFLDDPIEGDQFEQADDRWLAGGRASHRWQSGWRGRTVENVAGVQVRRDAIESVGLYHTRNRVRLSTTREDSVEQTSGGVYAESAVQWLPWLRSTAGVRADRYDVSVASDLAANGGRRSASLVSPKLSVVLGPWRNAELYINGGSGFHSNDARGATIRIDPASGEAVQPVTPLVRTRGAELGLRVAPESRLHATAALWRLDMASELLFIGDAGTTEASRPSRRTGIELAAGWQLRPWFSVDGDYAYSRARFTDGDPVGDRIPGAVEGVASVGLNVIDLRGVTAELRYRHFGARPLAEDDGVRSVPSNLLNARLGYALTPRVRLALDVFNLLDARVSDIDYFYTSRLPGEPAQGVDDLHFHPIEKRSARLTVTTTF